MFSYLANKKSMIFSHKEILIFLLLCSVLAISAAYISEYFFAMKPCTLCFYQRKPFFVVIALTLLALVVPFLKKYRMLAIELSVIALLINAFIAGYHFGVEKKIFKGLSSCSGVNYNPSTIEELRVVLNLEKPVPCNKPQFTFLKLSMAGWNLIYCLGLSSLVFFFYVKNNATNK